MLLMKREEIINAVFSEVRARLAEYTKTDEYKNYVIERIKAAKSAMGVKDATITLRPSDKSLENDVKSAWGNGARIVYSPTIENGGAMIASEENQIVVDETFDKRLIDAQSDFVKTSGLYFG